MQTRTQSLIEQIANIGTGFIISLMVWEWIVQPLIKYGYLVVDDGFIITTIFTITSFFRSYFWRRGFNHYAHYKLRMQNELIRANQEGSSNSEIEQKSYFKYIIDNLGWRN